MPSNNALQPIAAKTRRRMSADVRQRGCAMENKRRNFSGGGSLTDFAALSYFLHISSGESAKLDCAIVVRTLYAELDRHEERYGRTPPPVVDPAEEIGGSGAFYFGRASRRLWIGGRLTMELGEANLVLAEGGAVSDPDCIVHDTFRIKPDTGVLLWSVGEAGLPFDPRLQRRVHSVLCERVLACAGVKKFLGLA